MSAFSEAELDYLLTEFDHLVTRRRLGRLATVGKDGTPHVVPVGWRYNSEHDAIDIRGFDFEHTKKFRDVKRSGRAAIVVDDLASASLWRPRGVEVRGRAQAIDGPRPLIRIHPERVVSWGIDGEELSSRAVGEAGRRSSSSRGCSCPWTASSSCQAIHPIHPSLLQRRGGAGRPVGSGRVGHDPGDVEWQSRTLSAGGVVDRCPRSSGSRVYQPTG
jgi:pyridoxamine 5'-phosphate oxidase family protein